MSSRAATRFWFWTAVLLTVLKLWLTSGQRLYAIGPAFHDDRLFVDLAASLYDGHWLGAYNQFTLAKGPMYSVFIALVFWIGLPLLFAQQLLYASACAAFTRSVRTWISSGAAQCGLYALLLWNPMSFEAGGLTRVLRQNLYTPLALFALAGLVLWFVRRTEPLRRQLFPVLGAGLALGCFWLTREESVWLAPAVAVLVAAPWIAERTALAQRGRPLALATALLAVATLTPLAVVSTLNLRHYGWFGTVEFRAQEFKDAYGALTRLQVGPDLPQVPVTRQMREKAYEISPAFARLRPFIEGEVGDHWIERNLFPASERQIRGGWFVWALRDSVRAAGLAPDAGTAMRFYRQLADEINAACDSGRVPARPPRSGFVPALGPALAQPIYDTGVDFARFFVGFEKFTAYSPDSVGDYADLKPFRNVVGTRLSNAPRSPENPTPEQDRRNGWKLATLERIGSNFCSVVAWLGPVLLLVGLVRVLECALLRRLTYALTLALALLAACGAYLAINVLVQVTSFENQSPAALASAYPLYLAALALILADALAARRVRAEETPRTATPAAATASPAAWVAGAAALIVFAARLGEIHAFASDVPYNDQWVIEAEQLLAPWLNGTLGITDFFRPHFEHLPVWTRLLAWLQVAVTGRWDPLVQMTTNAALHAGFIWLAVRWVWQETRGLRAVALALLLVLTGALPHAWENIAWGFQSQFPLALILVFLHVHGSFTQPAGSRRWWLAQAAGIAGLGTLASFWLAPLAVALTAVWTKSARDRRALVPAAIAALGFALLLIVHSTGENVFTQGTRSGLGFIHSTLHLLGWPSVWAGAVAVVQLPWLIHALRLRSRADASALDRIIFALGLLNVLQAVALAFGRVGDSNDFVSRYGDLLTLGVLAGALALYRLVPETPRGRFGLLAVTAVWSVLVVAGLARNSMEGHARYFHLYAAERAATRRAAVQEFVLHQNRAPLEAESTRWVLYHDSALVARLLATPGFAALLPHSVNPNSPADAAGNFVRALQARWLGLLGAGLAAFAGTAAWSTWRRRGESAAVPLAVGHDPLRWRLAAAVALAAILPVLFWANPFGFDAARRWQQWLGGDAALHGLTFSFATPSAFGPERLQGAAPIVPESLRNQFFGTAPEGPGFTGTVLSSVFTLTKPWLIVPYSGYPVGHGNGMRIRLVDAAGNQVGDEIGCDGPNREDIGYWPVDVRKYVGQRARLILYDGRTDTQAWVAASPPVPAESPDLALELARGLQSESHSALRIAFGSIALVALLCAVFARRGLRDPAA